MGTKRTLNWLEVAIGLTSLHFGVGFLLGIGESSYLDGAQGALYGVSAALGVLMLTLITKFYWYKKDPLWTILGKKYGQGVENLISFFSCVWMIGIVASQALGGAFILSILGIPYPIGIWLLAIIINGMSLVKIDRLLKIFFFTLLASSLAMAFMVFWFPGNEQYFSLMVNFASTFPTISGGTLLGVMVTTVLITIFGMDFHQFVVSGKKISQTIKGEIVAFAALLLLSFLPVGIVQLGQGYTEGSITDPKQALPFILKLQGDKLFSGLGYVLIIALVCGVLGSGIGVTKVINRTLKGFKFIDREFKSSRIILLAGILIDGVLALFGKSIISLIVSFYAIYVASILIPFAIYLLEERGWIKVGKGQVYFSLLFGGIFSLSTFILSHFLLQSFKINVELMTLIVGLLGSIIGIWIPLVASSVNIKVSGLFRASRLKG